MTEITNCPSCNAKIKPNAVIGQNEIFSDEQCELIAEITQAPKKRICQKCSDGAFAKALRVFRDLRSGIQNEIKEVISNVPIITTHNPLNWDYQILGMATGQSTTGTGLFSEFTSSWTDLLGTQSNTYNKKILEGEQLCANQLRSKAIQMGGNAIIAADIDYSELGAGKGMIMVCMSGTVVKLKNLDVLPTSAVNNINRLSEASQRLFEWSVKYPEITRNLDSGVL